MVEMTDANPDEETQVNSQVVDPAQQVSQDHGLPTHQGIAALGQQHEQALLRIRSFTSSLTQRGSKLLELRTFILF